MYKQMPLSAPRAGVHTPFGRRAPNHSLPLSLAHSARAPPPSALIYTSVVSPPRSLAKNDKALRPRASFGRTLSPTPPVPPSPRAHACIHVSTAALMWQQAARTKDTRPDDESGLVVRVNYSGACQRASRRDGTRGAYEGTSKYTCHWRGAIIRRN